MLGSSSSNSKRDKYINTWIRVQYRFTTNIFLRRIFSPTKIFPDEYFSSSIYHTYAQRVLHIFFNKKLVYKKLGLRRAKN